MSDAAAARAQSEFRNGDTVTLKSGGPEMTVTAVEGDSIRCTWFEGKKPPHEKAFPYGALRRAGLQVALSALSVEERETLTRLLRQVLVLDGDQPQKGDLP